MKASHYALAALLLFAAAPSAFAAPETGQAAPAFSAVGSDGATHALADYRGKYVVLEWLNHDCPYVRKHYETGNMQALQKEATEKGVVWLSIISSAPGKQGHVSPEQADANTAEKGAHATLVLLDPEGKVGRLYEAKTTPHMFIVDPEGTLVYQGAIDDKSSFFKASVKTASNYVRKALAEAMAGAPVTEAQTKPYGCSVKY